MFVIKDEARAELQDLRFQTRELGTDNIALETEPAAFMGGRASSACNNNEGLALPSAYDSVRRHKTAA